MPRHEVAAAKTNIGLVVLTNITIFLFLVQVRKKWRVPVLCVCLFFWLVGKRSQRQWVVVYFGVVPVT